MKNHYLSFEELLKLFSQIELQISCSYKRQWRCFTRLEKKIISKKNTNNIFKIN